MLAIRNTSDFIKLPNSKLEFQKLEYGNLLELYQRRYYLLIPKKDVYCAAV